MDMYFPWRSIRTSAFEMHRFDILDRFFWHFLRSHFDAHNSRKISIGAQTHPKIWQLTSASSIYFLAAEHVQCMIMEWLWIAVFCQKNELISKESFHGNLFDWRYESILYVIFEKAWILKQSQWFHHFGSFSDHSDNPNDCFIRSWKVECVRG